MELFQYTVIAVLIYRSDLWLPGNVRMRPELVLHRRRSLEVCDKLVHHFSRGHLLKLVETKLVWEPLLLCRDEFR